MCNFSWETDFKEGLYLFSFPVLQPHNELSEKKEIHAAEPFFLITNILSSQKLVSACITQNAP